MVALFFASLTMHVSHILTEREVEAPSAEDTSHSSAGVSTGAAHTHSPLDASRVASPGACASSVWDEARFAAVAGRGGRDAPDTPPGLVSSAALVASLPPALRRELQDAERRPQLEEDDEEHGIVDSMATSSQFGGAGGLLLVFASA